MTEIKTEINYHPPIRLEDTDFAVRLERERVSLPQDLQQRVDAKFNDFADEAEAKSGKRPTKGEICTLSNFEVLSNGLKGKASIITFDQVLYFARSQIPEDDYAFGRTHVGFPLASWGVLSSTDNNLLFAIKKGSEGAYKGSRFSAFGSLVSAEKDIELFAGMPDGAGDSEFISPRKLIERSIGGEVGKAVWERVTGITHLGLNVYDENSSQVNNGYDTDWKIDIDADAETIRKLLVETPQFESKSSAVFVPSTPNKLREFAVANSTTMSGISGVFSYIGSHFGQDELVSQYMAYRRARGDTAVDLRFNEVRSA